MKKKFLLFLSIIILNFSCFNYLKSMENNYYDKALDYINKSITQIDYNLYEFKNITTEQLKQQLENVESNKYLSLLIDKKNNKIATNNSKNNLLFLKQLLCNNKENYITLELPLFNKENIYYGFPDFLYSSAYLIKPILDIFNITYDEKDLEYIKDIINRQSSDSSCFAFSNYIYTEYIENKILKKAKEQLKDNTDKLNAFSTIITNYIKPILIKIIYDKTIIIDINDIENRKIEKFVIINNNK